MATNNANNRSNPLGVSAGGFGVSSLTAYVPLCSGTTTTGAIQQATTGFSTAGAVLTSSGAGNLPSWQSGQGSFILLNTQTASSVASISFSSTYITSTYTSYFLKFTNVKNTSSSPSQGPFSVTFSTNNGSSYLSTSYQSGYIQYVYNSSTLANNSSTTLGLLCNASSTSANLNPLHGEIFFSFPQSGIASYVGRCTSQSSTNAFMSNCYGINSGTTAINNIKFAYNSNNIATGTFSLYGIIQ